VDLTLEGIQNLQGGIKRIEDLATLAVFSYAKIPVQGNLHLNADDSVTRIQVASEWLMLNPTPFLPGLSHALAGRQRRFQLDPLRAQSEQWRQSSLSQGCEIFGPWLPTAKLLPTAKGINIICPCNGSPSKARWTHCGSGANSLKIPKPNRAPQANCGNFSIKASPAICCLTALTARNRAPSNGDPRIFACSPNRATK